MSARVQFIEQRLGKPFVLSTGPICELTEARVNVVIQTQSGEIQEGFGSIYLSDLWAWPDTQLDHATRDAALRMRCEDIAQNLAAYCGDQTAHPLILGLELHENVCHSPSHDDGRFKDMPLLATAMCASPFDAAIHDAVGQAMGISAMELYRDQPIPTSADKWFTGSSAYAAIGRMLNRQPRKHFPAWLLVGKNDDLENDVRPWYHNRGYRYFKLKLHGQDLREDVERTVDVVNASRSWQCMPTLSVDTNEACHDAAYVQEYLNQLLAKDTVAFGCLKYLEQPTARDIAANPHDWKQVSQRKPILLDEGLTSLDRLPLAVEQGWSGLALKTCKGHSFALVAAAWAMENNLMLAMQDLTNPGYSAMHSAIFAAYVPTINGVELNSPQFTPAANAPFINEWSGLLNVTDGYHHLPKHIPTGLGGNIML